MDEHQQERQQENQPPIHSPNLQPPTSPSPYSPSWQPNNVTPGQTPIYPYPPSYQQDIPQYSAFPPNAGGPPDYPPQQQGFPPPFPPQRAQKKLQWWHWILIGSASLLLLCCIIGAIAASQDSQSQNKQPGAAVVATRSLTTATPAPTATPIPSPTPLPAWQGKHMALGANYKQDGQNFTIIQPKGTFHSGDSLAFVIRLDNPIGTTQAQLILASEDSGGAESTVFSQNTPISDPTFNEFANRFPNIGTIMAAYGQGNGKYKLKLSDGHQILAEAEFTYAA